MIGDWIILLCVALLVVILYDVYRGGEETKLAGRAEAWITIPLTTLALYCYVSGIVAVFSVVVMVMNNTLPVTYITGDTFEIITVWAVLSLPALISILVHSVLFTTRFKRGIVHKVLAVLGGTYVSTILIGIMVGLW